MINIFTLIINDLTLYPTIWKTFLSLLQATRRDRDEVEKKLNNARIEIRKHMENQKQLEHETMEKINNLVREQMQIRK